MIEAAELLPSKKIYFDAVSTYRDGKRECHLDVWEFFPKKEIKGIFRHEFTVENCNRNFSVRSSASIVRGHLCDHGLLQNDGQACFQPGRLLEDCSTKQPLQRENGFWKNLFQWIVDAGLSFSTVKNKIFQKMISTFDENFYRDFLFEHQPGN